MKQVIIIIPAICLTTQPLFSLPVSSSPAPRDHCDGRLSMKDSNIFQFFLLTSQHRSYNLSLNSLSLNKGAPMGLKDELGLRKGFKNYEHEGILNIFYTGDMISKKARSFFAAYGLTEAQFNIMSILYHQPGGQHGLTQAAISDMMLVHRSNITFLVDRIEKSGLAKRKPVQGDRRYYSVHLTKKGKKLFKKVEHEYMIRIEKIMGNITEPNLKRLIAALEHVRENLRTLDWVTLQNVVRK